MTTTYPLSWPEGWPRSRAPQASKFKTTVHRALTNVEDSLARFAKDSGHKVTGYMVSSNYSLTDRNPSDGGVAVYFTWDGISTCIAVDRYPKIEDNLQAIHHVIEAERTKLRHGGLNLVRAAFRGYAALPPPSAAGAADWRSVLELKGSSVTLREAEQAYRALARRNHPDQQGGSTERMTAINNAIAQARKELGNG